MPTVTIKFEFVDRTSGSEQEVCKVFEAQDGVTNEIDECIEETLNALNVELEDDFRFVRWSVVEHDDEYADPTDFADLDAYGEYAEKCEEHGEAYRLRYADIGDHNFRNEYVGCYRNVNDFVREDFTSCNDIPGNLDRYIDWDLVAQDWLADYSTYEGSEGIHIFRD